MAVTITVAELRAALRLNDSAEETAEVTRLLAYATEAIEQHAPTATETAMNEAVRRLGEYLFDMPEAARGDGYANALRYSGAARMLLPYRVHRLGLAEAVSAAQAAVGTVGNPVTGLCRRERPARGHLRGREHRRAGPARRSRCSRPDGAGFGGGGAVRN